MARRTKDEAIKTRNTILVAAQKVFYKRGVTRTSLEQIAEEAGVTRGAVYWHFKDKRELCDAMAKSVMLPYEDMLKDLAAQPSSEPLEGLRKSCVHSLEMMAKDKKRQQIISIFLLRCEYVDEMLGVKKRLDECEDRLLILCERIFARAKELNMLASCWSPRQAATATLALITGLILGGLEQRKSFGFATVGVACVEAFFNSLRVN